MPSNSLPQSIQGKRPAADSCEHTASTEQREARPDFNIALNGYRGLCAGLVFIYHLGAAGVMPLPHGDSIKDGLAYLWSSLAYGVEMFFMISGFVILGSLLRHATVAGFLKDRFIRIFSAWVPALIAVTLVCSALNLKMLSNMSFLERFGIFIANLMLLPPLLPLPLIHFGSWSLSYEWVFYFTAAMGAILLRRKPTRAWAIALWAILGALFVCLFPRALFFLSGVIVFVRQHWILKQQRWLRFPVISLLIFLVAWKSTEANQSQLSDTLFDWLRDGRWIAACIAFAASLHMFACVCLNPNGQFAFLKSQFFQFLGTISYSFYLWHALVMAGVKRVINTYVVPIYGYEVGFAAFAAICMAIAVPLSWVSWRVFEVGLAKFARRKIAPKPLLGAAVSAT